MTDEDDWISSSCEVEGITTTVRRKEMPLKSLEELEQLLGTLDMPEEERREILEHEKAHFDKAVQLGYPPLGLVYRAHQILINGKVHSVEYDFATQINLPIPAECLREIALAPEKPGNSDLRLDSQLSQEISRYSSNAGE